MNKEISPLWRRMRGWIAGMIVGVVVGVAVTGGLLAGKVAFRSAIVPLTELSTVFSCSQVKAGVSLIRKKVTVLVATASLTVIGNPTAGSYAVLK